ncbi:MAG: RdgB/HAM1 family non-canonical purine NTP pyrophosphatase [bacterium]|nr:RdgB/HAM1 family non-canonical purine NTP pyrophosphatase [bacterium]
MIKLLAATTNKGKLEEIKDLFDSSSVQIKLYSLSDFNITADCPETGETFAENAAQKSLFYSQMAPDIYTAGDDSGLAVEALNGEPGVYSSRYSGPNATDDKNTAKLLEQLKGIPNRNAKFVTTVCLSKNGQLIATFTGEVKGIIIDERQGNNGFGYDPVFYYPPYKKTFAQLTTEEKNHISHRSQAFEQLKDYFTKII